MNVYQFVCVCVCVCVFLSLLGFGNGVWDLIVLTPVH